jgi:hypothetical protein
MQVKAEADGALSVFRRRSWLSIPREKAVSDLIYIALGVGVLLLFAGYAVVLRRA